MASSNEPQPDHALVTNLDPAFAGPGGNAPALAGWLEYLAHPEENTGPRVLEFSDGSGIESNGKPDPDVAGHLLERTVLRDLTVDRFFAHADVLSGQRVGTLSPDGEISNTVELGRTYDLIEETFRKKATDSTRPEHSVDMWMRLTSNVDAVVSRENWDSGAADRARDRFIQLKQWYENHRNPGLNSMNEYLVKYAAIILKARQDVNELMGKLVATLDSVTARSAQEGLSFAVSTLDRILNFALNPPDTAKDAVLFVSDAISSAMEPATKSTEDSGFGFDTTDIHLGYYRMFESFIRAGDLVCWEAADAVAKLITDAEHGMLFVRRNWMSAPAWPAR